MNTNTATKKPERIQMYKNQIKLKSEKNWMLHILIYNNNNKGFINQLLQFIHRKRGYKWCSVDAEVLELLHTKASISTLNFYNKNNKIILESSSSAGTNQTPVCGESFWMFPELSNL